MELTIEQFEQYQRDGFVVVDELLDKQMVERFERNLGVEANHV
ncbi:hypothetical protein [Natronomonas amylolytica]